MSDRTRFILLNAALLSVAEHGGEPAAELDTQQNLIIALPDGDFADRQTFDRAKKLCAELRLGGHDDWRLPTDVEACAAIDRSMYSPATASEAFASTQSHWCWTSTPCAWAPGRASWCVAFANGGVGGSGGHGNGAFVRAVRSASPAAGQ